MVNYIRISCVFALFCTVVFAYSPNNEQEYDSQFNRYREPETGQFRQAASQIARDKRGEGCKTAELVNCFVKSLEKYTLKLWQNKINIVALTAADCEHVKVMGKCIDNAEAQFQCTKADVLNTSQEITKLLVHRNTKSTFVKSYYMLKYACSAEGQAILAQESNRQCLLKERISESTLAASTYLADQYLDIEPQKAFRQARGSQTKCATLTKKVDEYKQALSSLCSGQATKIMCNSLVSMIKGVYFTVPEGDTCKLDCELKPPAGNDGAAPGETVKATANALDADNPATGHGYRVASALGQSVPILATLALARWL